MGTWDLRQNFSSVLLEVKMKSTFFSFCKIKEFQRNLIQFLFSSYMPTVSELIIDNFIVIKQSVTKPQLSSTNSHLLDSWHYHDGKENVLTC